MSQAWTLLDGSLVTEPPTAPLRSERLDDDAAVDHTLIRRWQRGDEQAFRLLYERHRAPLLRFLARLLPDPAEAAEVAQDAWLGFIRGRDRYSPLARFSTFLFGIAHRRVVDHWRRRAARPEALAMDIESVEEIEGLAAFAAGSWREPPAQAESAALAEALSRAVDSLPLPQRETFLLRAEAGLSLEEIAAVTGACRETAKTRLRYATARLRRALEGWT